MLSLGFLGGGFKTGRKDFECILIEDDYVFFQSVLNEFSSKVYN